ncbi:DUF624 domain-containing protein [Enterococcus hirae]|nr:DUF624 domain-containing protein [Enterococcus hirae]
MNQHKRSPHSIFDFTYSLGKFLLFLIKLQVFWFLSVLKGCILLGTFPASVTVLKFFYHLFEEKQIPQVLYSDFQTSFNNLFISTNQLGYAAGMLLGFLWMDLRIAAVYLQNPFIHMGILLLFIATVIVILYLFPVFLRYDLSFTQYFKQALFLSLCSLIETVAIILGIFVVTVVSTFFPILTIVAFVPLFCLPLSWFSLQSMIKIEEKNRMLTQ